MKKILLLTLAANFVLFSCKSEAKKQPETGTIQEQETKVINLDSLSDMQLYYYMEELEKNILNEETMEVSKELSIKILAAAQKHLVKFPDSDYRREVIRKGSRASQGLNQDYEAIRIISIAISENQADSTIVEEYNLRAFLYDKMNAKEDAKEAYNEIIAKFPNHASTANHKARLKTIDLSDEELIKLFEAKNAK